MMQSLQFGFRFTSDESEACRKSVGTPTALTAHAGEPSTGLCDCGNRSPVVPFVVLALPLCSCADDDLALEAYDPNDWLDDFRN